MERGYPTTATKTFGTRPSELAVCPVPKKGEETSSPQSTASGDDLRSISHKESPAIVEILLPLFAKIDLNNDGVLSPDELAIAVPVLKEHPSGVGNVVAKYLANAELTQRGSVLADDWRRYVESMAEQSEFPDWLLKSLASIVSSLDIRDRKPAGASSVSSESPTSKSKLQRRPWSRELGDKKSSLVDVLCLLFEKVDVDGDGIISADELAAAAPRLRENTDGSGQVLVSYLQNADSTKRGCLSQDDWERYVLCMTKFTFSDDLLKKILVAVKSLDKPRAASPKRVASPKDAEHPKMIVRSVTEPLPESPTSPTQEAAAGSRSAPEKLKRRPTWTSQFDQDRTTLTDLFIRLFEKIDQDHDGILSVDELALAVPLLKRQKSGGGQALVHYLEQAGLQKKGFVTMEDWEKYVGCMRSLTLPGELQQAFTSVIDGLDEALAAERKSLETSAAEAEKKAVKTIRDALSSLKEEVPSQEAPSATDTKESVSIASRIFPDLFSSECASEAKPQCGESAAQASASEKSASTDVAADVAADGAAGAANLPGNKQDAAEPASELPAAASEAAGSGLPIAELRLEGNTSFDPNQPEARSIITKHLGIDSDVTVKALEGFAGGLNEGVWVLSESGNAGKDLVLKLVRSQRRIPTVPTDAENLLRLSKELPGITEDSSLAFPLLIIAIIGESDEKRYDFIIMRKARGQSLSDIIAIKVCFKQVDDLLVIMERLGACLYSFHYRYGDLQHGDFQPSNIFYDERNETFTLIDVGGIGVPTVDTDVEHFRKSMSICFSSNGPDFISNCLDRLEQGYAAAKSSKGET